MTYKDEQPKKEEQNSSKYSNNSSEFAFWGSQRQTEVKITKKFYFIH